MSRGLFRGCCGALFLWVGTAFCPLFATEWVATRATSPPIAAADLLPTVTDATFENHRLELDRANPSRVTSYGDDAPSQLFATPANPDPTLRNDANNSEWEYLWRNASRIPITTIPEPTIGSLVLGGALLLWARRDRKLVK